MSQQSSSQQQWNTTLYDNQHSFVWQYGASVVELLAPQPGERILDLGCGTGHLTAKIAATGAIATGIDSDPSMIATAQQTYPNLTFAIADARNFHSAAPVDAIFSNATLHWVKEPDAVIRCIAAALKPGGRFVAEFGGKGNIGAIATALFTTLKDFGYVDCESWNPWYFPSISDYTTRLEQQGLEVTYAVLFDRPTPLEAGEAGLRHWLQMFANGILAQVDAEMQQRVIQVVEAQLQPVLYDNGLWKADYRRLRVVARKI